MREIAAERGFAVAAKPDSHDICFIPDGDTRGFLARRLGEPPGPVVDAATGATVGEHDGTYGFTVGQREGLGVAVGDQRPRYVLGIEPVSRTVTDRHRRPRRRSTRCAPARPPGPVPAPALPFAGRGAAAGARRARSPARSTADGDGGLRIALAEEQRGVAPGQSAVLYEPDAAARRPGARPGAVVTAAP